MSSVRPIALLATLLLLACPASRPAAHEAASSKELDAPRPPAELRGDTLEGALTPGETIPAVSFTTLDGRTVQVPDPSGGYVVLELIRSADW
ncbi:MAG: hypothetical protein KDA24_13105 [Deltaproteobacteria bacterium]|nr:hypothetical protein [Deltaproteobacteria bacterium]